MEQLFGSLPAILNALGENTAVDEQLVFAAWKRVAGSQLGEHAKPIEFFENRLIVAVANETWRVNVEAFARELVAKLNMKLGENKVRFIEFRIEPKLFLKARIATSGDGREIPATLAEAAENIADPKLRETFLSAAAVYLGASAEQ